MKISRQLVTASWEEIRRMDGSTRFVLTSTRAQALADLVRKARRSEPFETMNTVAQKAELSWSFIQKIEAASATAPRVGQLTRLIAAVGIADESIDETLRRTSTVGDAPHTPSRADIRRYKALDRRIQALEVKVPKLLRATRKRTRFQR